MIYSRCVAGGCLLPSPPRIWWRWCHYLTDRRWSEISQLLYTLSQTSFCSGKGNQKKEKMLDIKTVLYNFYIIMQPLFPVILKELSVYKTKQNMWIWWKTKKPSREMNQTEIVYFLPAHLGHIRSEGNTVNSWDITVQSLSSHSYSHTDHTLKHSLRGTRVK